MRDSQEILNSEEVEFLLEGSTPSSQETATKAGTQPVATMRGDLQQMSLADVFQTIGTAKMEGVLKVCNPVEQRQIVFKDGVARIVVPPRTFMRRLGQRLVQAGVLDPEQLRLALLEQRKEHRPLGDLLVDGGYVTPEQIEEILQMQISEELFGLFTWEHGDFEFYKGPPEDQELLERLSECPEFEVSSLLLEVARRSDEWQTILESLRSLDEVPVPGTQTEVDDSINELQRSVLLAVDGRRTYRELADNCMLSVFDCARAARDLMQAGYIAVATDEQIVGVAKEHLELGHGKMALMLAQTLCSRGGDRPTSIVREIAALMRSAGESARACAVLLEAAQLESNPRLAMELAQEARAMNPRDLAAVSFLRTVMLAHMPTDSPEIETITMSLLDGLLHDNDIDGVSAIVEETRKLESYTPSVMLREARALAKKKDKPGAIAVLEAAALRHAEAGDVPRQIEALDMAFRLDRERKDLHKLIRQLRSTPQSRAVRLGSIIAVALALLCAGLMWIFAEVHGKRLKAASEEIAALLQKGDHRAAAAAMARWQDLLGECEEVSDLHQQIRFVEANEAQRVRKEALRRAAVRMQEAGELMLAGDLIKAFAIYDELRADAVLRPEIESAQRARIEALLRDLSEIERNLPQLLPEAPSAVTERQEIEEALTVLRRAVPERLVLSAKTLRRQRDALPAAIPEATRQQLRQVADQAGALLDRASELIGLYESASERKEQQRNLDPLFKRALEAERALDFAGALAAYRLLAASDAGGEQVMSHFGQKLKRLEGIVGACAAIAAATKAGDFATANREYEALCRSQPHIPFHQIVRLPVHLRSSVPGAHVRWNGKALGSTPLLTTYEPGSQNLVEMQFDRFARASQMMPLNHGGTLEIVLTLLPDRVVALPAGISQQMTVGPDGRVFAADNQGAVLAIDVAAGAIAWRVETKDTAGYLSPPLVAPSSIIVASLDGPLRCFDQKTGGLQWQREDLATEFAPALADGRLAVATTAGPIVVFEPQSGNELGRFAPPAVVRGDLLASDRLVLASLDDGTTVAFDVQELVARWRSKPGAMGQGLYTTPRGVLTLRDDDQIALVDARTGALRWERTLQGTPTGRPATGNDRVVVTFDDRMLLLALDSGREVWNLKLPAEGLAEPVRMVGSKVAAPTRTSGVHLFAGDESKPRYSVGGDRELSLCGDGTSWLVVAAGRRLAIYRRLP